MWSLQARPSQLADHARVDSPAIVPSVLSAPSCVLWIPLVCQGARGEALSYKLSSHDRQANLCSHQVRWRAVLLTSARVSPTHVSSEQTETLRQGANAMCNYTLSCQHVITMARRLSINSMKSCTLIQTACAFLNSSSLAHSLLKRLRNLGEGALEYDVVLKSHTHGAPNHFHT